MDKSLLLDMGLLLFLIFIFWTICLDSPTLLSGDEYLRQRHAELDRQFGRDPVEIGRRSDGYYVSCRPIEDVPPYLFDIDYFPFPYSSYCEIVGDCKLHVTTIFEPPLPNFYEYSVDNSTHFRALGGSTGEPTHWWVHCKNKSDCCNPPPTLIPLFIQHNTTPVRCEFDHD